MSTNRQDRDRRSHHRLRGGAPDPLGALLRVEAQVAGDGRERGGEAAALDGRVPEIERPEEVARPVLEIAVREPERALGGEIAHHDAHCIGEHGERRDHEQPRDHAWDEQVRHGRAAQALERIDLLRDPHGAELGGVARADAAGQDQRRQHRTELQDHRFGDDGAGIVQRQRAGELVAGLEARHRAGEPGHQEDDEQRPVAYRGRLLERAGDPHAPFRESAEHVGDEKGEAAGVIGRAQAPAGDQPQGVQRDRRTVTHGLYLGYPWPVRPPLTPFLPPVPLGPHPLSPSPSGRGGTTLVQSFPSPEGRGDQRGEDRCGA